MKYTLRFIGVVVLVGSVAGVVIAMAVGLASLGMQRGGV